MSTGPKKQKERRANRGTTSSNNKEFVFFALAIQQRHGINCLSYHTESRIGEGGAGLEYNKDKIPY